MALIEVPVTKGGGVVQFDTDTIPAEVYAAALAEGLKAFVNKGMAKIATKGLEGEKLEQAKAAAMKKGEENAEAIRNGTIKLPGKKAKSKVSGAIMTEAMRLARATVKAAMKEAKLKLSHYKASQISALAKQYLETDEGKKLIDKAKENLEAREEIKLPAGLLGSIQADPTLVAKAAEEKANKPMSAKQASLVKPRAKPAQATAH